MIATRFSSLTEYAKCPGREGICRVTEEEGEGLFIAWIDNSPEALQRRDAVQKLERQAKNDEKQEQKEIAAQIDRAWQTAAPSEKNTSVQSEEASELREVPKFKLPPRQREGQVESRKRKNVFQSSKRGRSKHGKMAQIFRGRDKPEERLIVILRRERRDQGVAEMPNPFLITEDNDIN